MFIYSNSNKETFTAGGEVDQNFTTYLTRGYIISPGTVVMWSGAITSIPTGYVLCDGTNGTPDLRDKFIVGASTNSKYRIGNVGGNDTIVLTTDQLPSHSHTGTTANSNINPGCSQDGSGEGQFRTAKQDSKGQRDCGNSGHTHSFTTDATGSSKGVDIRPSYYSLAFIMKTSN